jgi:plasmid stabilization system protein ParE
LPRSPVNKMRIRLALQARTDLDLIWLFVARESGNHEIASRVVGSIVDKFSLFAKFPYIGKTLASERHPNVRIFPASNYLIFYSIQPEEIRVLRIIHASRDVQAIFADESC